MGDATAQTRQKRRRRRDGGVSDASEEKKVSSSTKSEAYNAVTRSMYCSCTVDVERVAEQNRKGHRRCTGRRATIIIFKYHIMSPGIRSCAASLAQAEPARPRNAFAHRSQHEPSTYRYPAVTTLVFAFSFTRHSRTDSQLKCGRPESAWHKKQI